MSELQHAAETIAANVIGCTPQELSDSLALYQAGESVKPILGIDIIAIATLVEMIMTMVMDIIEQCPERAPERIVAGLKRPNLLQRARHNAMVRAELRNTDQWRGRRHARKVAFAMRQVANDAPDADVANVVQECLSYAQESE